MSWLMVGPLRFWTYTVRSPVEVCAWLGTFRICAVLLVAASCPRPSDA